MISFERLREVMDYDPETGFLTWKVNKSRKIKAGSRAGSYSKKATDRTGYRAVFIDDRLYREHRLVFLWMTGFWPDGPIDHVDGDGTNNSWDNLRKATPSQNSGNAKLSKANMLGIKGVSKIGNRYTARITVNKTRVYLGLFKTPEDASAAYAAASRKYYGEFSRVA